MKITNVLKERKNKKLATYHDVVSKYREEFNEQVPGNQIDLGFVDDDWMFSYGEFVVNQGKKNEVTYKVYFLHDSKWENIDVAGTNSEVAETKRDVKKNKKYSS